MASFHLILLILIVNIFIAGCTQISLSQKPRHSLIQDNSFAQMQPSSGPSSAQPFDLSGQWTIGFRLSGQTKTGSMYIKQSGVSFSGYGKDSDNGQSFKIEKGAIKNHDIVFLKRYLNDNSQPVQYHGQFSYLSSDNSPGIPPGQKVPYMGGDFSKEINGTLITGDWEAEQNKSETANNTTSGLNTPQPEVAKGNVSSNEESQSQEINHMPDLSGKWNVAFENNFKVIHSIMFLEQDGNKLAGHGVDTESGNRFVIKNGWYHFPHASFIREYTVVKKVGHLFAGREITFKADVKIVKDPDYQGPYLTGKTQGGGSWEAERIE